MKINCLVQSAGNSGWSVFSCNKIILIIFSANFNKPESCQSGSTASNDFNDSSVVSPISVNSRSMITKSYLIVVWLPAMFRNAGKLKGSHLPTKVM